MIFFEPQGRDRRLMPHDPFKAMVIPRPVGWISTMSAAGEVNLAPYSYFNGFSTSPMIVGFSSEGAKDSQVFAMETREFVWSMATYDLRDQMNVTSAALPRGQSEFAFARLETAPSRLVKPPRVKASPAALECRVTQMVDLVDVDGCDTGRRLVLGRVVGLHVDERFLKDGRLDAAAMRPIARCGYDEYTVVERVFSMGRPAGGGDAFGDRAR
ncbi:MAG: flavin reductase family protein [Betaproteobacteria bacterium]|nr:flavin reductase family protein [Betaproteobacteria bacterium]